MLFVHRTVLSCVKNNNKEKVSLWNPIVLYNAEKYDFLQLFRNNNLMGKDGSKKFGFVNLFLIKQLGFL